MAQKKGGGAPPAKKAGAKSKAKGKKLAKGGELSDSFDSQTTNSGESTPEPSGTADPSEEAVATQEDELPTAVHSAEVDELHVMLQEGIEHRKTNPAPPQVEAEPQEPPDPRKESVARLVRLLPASEKVQVKSLIALRELVTDDSYLVWRSTFNLKGGW